MKRARYEPSQSTTLATTQGSGASKSSAYSRRRSYALVRPPRSKGTSLKDWCDLGLGFPKKVKVTMKYVAQVGLTLTAGAAASYVFSCNGLYDPNITGTGHQPLYFDQFTALYDHYCVIGSKIHVKVVAASDLNTPTLINLYIDDNASVVATSPLSLAEQSLAKPIQYLWNGNKAQLEFNEKWSAKKFFGASVLANTELQGTSGANPTDQSYYIITGQPANFSDSQTIQLLVTIEYITVWKELRDIAQS